MDHKGPERREYLGHYSTTALFLPDLPGLVRGHREMLDGCVAVGAAVQFAADEDHDERQEPQPQSEEQEFINTSFNLDKLENVNESNCERHEKRYEHWGSDGP